MGILHIPFVGVELIKGSLTHETCFIHKECRSRKCAICSTLLAGTIQQTHTSLDNPEVLMNGRFLDGNGLMQSSVVRKKLNCSSTTEVLEMGLFSASH